MWGPCHQGITCPQVVDEGYVLQTWRVAVNIMNKQQLITGDSLKWGVSEGLTTPHFHLVLRL
jgi:hypothetical protein